ncbi:MAG: hypothetical protein LIR50_10015 [Bacillota bacterium]|nr:hypothetical protein [Bacillota bacterium]
MLRISWFEFIVRGIPEEFLFVLAVHAFSKTGINLKKYILSGTLFWIMAYLIRLLPIQYGINTILSLIALIIIVNFINKIDIVKSIRSGLITLILEFIFEGINLIFIQFVFKIDLKIVMNNPIAKTLYGFPSIILFGIFVIAYYIRLSKQKELVYN